MRCEMLREALISLGFFFFFLVSSCVRGDSSGSESERWVLSELKRGVSDPDGVLSSWDSTDLRHGLRHHCSWRGVYCDSYSRVVALRIAGRRGEGRGDDSGALSFSLSRGFGRVGAGGSGRLRGQISPWVGKLRQLRVLSLPFNDLFGEIPEEIWGLENLQVLDLEGNSLTGNLPLSFSGLSKLRVLNLGFNKVRGEIPTGLFHSPDLKILNLAGNVMSGSIPAPSGSGSCKSLKHLDLSGNSLTGQIPASLGGCKGLRTLRLFSNNLNGAIPHELNRLSKLKILDISGNRLIGDSRNFRRGRALTSVAVTSKDQEDLSSSSQNETDYQTGNSGLNSIEVASVASASAIVAVLLALIVLFFYTRKWMPDSRVQGLEPREITMFGHLGSPLTFENIVRSTGNFSASNCIGNGGFGSTFKSELRSGVIVAVKRLSVGRFQQGIQQFHAEVKTLGRVRHPNLVTLLGYHASETEMFLIYNYLPGGNLEKFIKERSSSATDWKVLHKIALDIAQALAYLHDSCVPRVLHRDVKPSNILLDNDLNAYLSDFGLSRLLGTSETHATTGVAGTFGYLAPEYAMTCRVSDKSDVYSYGVVLLELISDKRPLDPSFSSYGDGFNIVSWGSMLLKQGRAKEVFTVGLWDAGPHDDLVEMLHLAITCTDETLSTRPSMKNVVQRLKRLKPVSLGSS